MLSFLLVTLVLFGMVSLTANALLDRQFRTYVLEQQEKDNLRFQQMGASSGAFAPDLSGNHDRLATAEDWGILSIVHRFVENLF